MTRILSKSSVTRTMLALLLAAALALSLLAMVAQPTGAQGPHADWWCAEWDDYGNCINVVSWGDTSQLPPGS